MAPAQHAHFPLRAELLPQDPLSPTPETLSHTQTQNTQDQAPSPFPHFSAGAGIPPMSCPSFSPNSPGRCCGVEAAPRGAEMAGRGHHGQHSPLLGAL